MEGGEISSFFFFFFFLYLNYVATFKRRQMIVVDRLRRNPSPPTM